MASELNKDISLFYNKIISKIANFINNSNNNQILILKKLKLIDNYIRKILQENNITLDNLLTRDKISSLREQHSLYTDIEEPHHYYTEKDLFESLMKEQIKNNNCISSNHYFVIKLRRKLKEQHEKNKIRELGYLERICSLQNKLSIYENNKCKNKLRDSINKNEKNMDIVDKKKINFLLNLSDNKKPISFSKEKDDEKVYNKLIIKNFNLKSKQINKSLEDNINNKKNKLFLQTFSNLRQEHKQKLFKNIDFSNFDFNNEASKIPNNEKKLFLNKYQIMSLKNPKNKNINISIRHDFNEIKKTVENGKRKMRFLKDCHTPELYKKYKTLFDTDN